jgi:hypothetical protein
MRASVAVTTLVAIAAMLISPPVGHAAKPDRTPPQTTITSGPSGTVSAQDASFSFSSSESRSTFQCRLDGAAWSACTSPKLYSGLTAAAHRFEVRAIDRAGNVDPTPAARDWTIAVSQPPPSDTQPGFPIRAAFYYPWFPEAWTQSGIYPFTKYTPSAGFYDSSSTAVIQQHIRSLEYGHVEAGIASWWGQGTHTDTRIPTLLSATRALGSDFRWALYYEPEGSSNPSAAAIEADLRYIRDRYGSDPAYLRVNGRFVVFVYADAQDACAMADRWKQANAAVDAYLVLKVFGGYRTCTSQPQGWHQYSPAVAADSQSGYSYSISPGFNKAGELAPRHDRLERAVPAHHHDERVGRGHVGRECAGVELRLRAWPVPRRPAPRGSGFGAAPRHHATGGSYGPVGHSGGPDRRAQLEQQRGARSRRLPRLSPQPGRNVAHDPGGDTVRE